MVLCYNKP